LIFVLVSGAAGAQAIVRNYSVEEQAALLHAPALKSQKQAMEEMLGRRDWEAQGQWAQKTVEKTAQQPLENEFLLQQWLLWLRNEPAPAALRESIEALTKYESKALVPSPEPEHGAGQWVPAYNLAASARGTLRTWELKERVAGNRRALAAGNVVDLSWADADALAKTLEEATAQELQVLRKDALSLPTQPLSVLARRLADASLYRALFKRPADEFSLRALDEMAATLPPEQAGQELREAASNPALASAAILALSQLPQVQAELMACLSDIENGGSCAQGLARDPGNLPSLTALLARNEDTAAARRALLALMWMKTPESRIALEQYAADPNQPASLREEVGKWLR
jgi:hypothetical protein